MQAMKALFARGSSWDGTVGGGRLVGRLGWVRWRSMSGRATSTVGRWTPVDYETSDGPFELRLWGKGPMRGTGSVAPNRSVSARSRANGYRAVPTARWSR